LHYKLTKQSINIILFSLRSCKSEVNN